MIVTSMQRKISSRRDIAVLQKKSSSREGEVDVNKQGVPSLAMKVGFEPGSAEETVFKQWLTDRYHAPSDDADQPVNLEAAAGFEEVMRGLTVQIANDPRRPAWKSDSFFRRFAKAAP